MDRTTESSAGGLVLRRNAGGHIEVLLIQQSGHRGWGFPKGWIEPGEEARATAVREVQEEAGVVAEIIAELRPTRYYYVNRQKQRVAKTVLWYLMRYAGQGDQTHAHEVIDVQWLPLEAVHSRLTYGNDKELFSLALPDILRATI